MSNLTSATLSSLARRIDEAKTTELEEQWPTKPMLVLSAVAAPAFAPRREWQQKALEDIELEDLRAPRQLVDYERKLAHAAKIEPNREAFMGKLRRFCWFEKVRIALRELLPPGLGGAPIHVTARELSYLAEACLKAALASAQAEETAPSQSSEFVALGMGKLGGLELNANSDIDLIFFCEDARDAFATREQWSAIIRRTSEILEKPTEDGLVWRVDLRLRPEGSRGALINSLTAAEQYYTTWGRLWERAALLRSRTVAGNEQLATALYREIITPFVFQRAVEPSIATRMAELCKQARLELSRNPERDIKLGPGGIREAEFFVQSLQLIWGGLEPSLRVAGTQQALKRLQGHGFVSDLEAQRIADAYRLLRRVEHRIQWRTGFPTHELSDDNEERTKTARCLGYSTLSEFDQAIARSRQQVQELFASLAPNVPATASAFSVVLAKVENQGPEALARFSEEAFASSEVGEHLVALMHPPNNLLGALSRERHPELADNVAHALSECADAEQGARYLRSFFGRFLSPHAYVLPLARDERGLRRLIGVLGASALVGDAIVKKPDLADLVLFGRPTEFEPKEVVQRAAKTAQDVDPEQRRDALISGLRESKRELTVQVALQDLSGILNTRQSTNALSAIADETLEQASEFVAGPASGLAVLAVGKLGGRELGYASDLDILFLFEAKPGQESSEAVAEFTQKAQRILRLISEPHGAGAGYELDTRLRPSGSHGLLVTSLDAFARYHRIGGSTSTLAAQSSGATWERQALVRARFCAGDPRVGKRAEELARKAAFSGQEIDLEEAHRLRQRIEIELGREKKDRFDLKMGRGGLLDVEFCVQLLQMLNGHQQRLHTPDTWLALERLAQYGILTRTDAELLREGYEFLRKLEQRIVIVHGKASTRLQAGAPGLRALARRMEIPTHGERRAEEMLLERYRSVTAENRRIYLNALGLGNS